MTKLALFWQLLPLIFLSLTACGQQGPEAAVEPFPQFQLYGSFEELKPLLEKDNDTTYVINFWATWCKPCVAELPYFDELYDQYRGEKVQLVLVSLDFPQRIESDLKPFIEERGLKPPVIALTDIRFNDWIDRVDPSWSGAIPATLVYRGEKRSFLEQSFESAAELEEAIKPYLD